MWNRIALNISFVSPTVFLPSPAWTTHSRYGTRPPRACAKSLSPEDPPGPSVSRKRPYGYWKKREHVHAELLEFVREHSQEPLMPTQSDLINAGRVDLAGAIRRAGSWHQVADEVGLVLSSIAKPRSLNLIFCTDLKLRSGGMRPYMYWRDFENLRSELIDTIQRLCDVEDMEECGGVIPSASQLEKAGRSDIVRAIRVHGGWNAVAKKLGMGVGFRPKGYWEHFPHIEEEVRKIISEHMPTSESNTMPSLSLLRKHGSPGLYHAVVRRFGGAAKVAKQMGLSTARKPHGYWNPETLKREVLDGVKALCQRHPDRDPSLMPTKAELRSIGRGQVYSAVERMGGMHYISTQVGLRCRGPPPNRGNWDVLRRGPNITRKQR